MLNLYYGNVPENILDIYRVIDTGTANCYLAYGKALIDVGVAYKYVKDYVYDLEVILLTHRHSDHINYTTLKRIQKVRSTLPVYCGTWLVKDLENNGIKNIRTITTDNIYVERSVTFQPFSLEHNVKNVGYHLLDKVSGKVIFHATDLGNLPPQTAHNADVVAIEFNHDAEEIKLMIENEIASMGFSHYLQSQFNHLSFQKARYFIENRTKGEEHITVVKLHTSDFFKKDLDYV